MVEKAQKNMRIKTILITGASGFLGSKIHDELSEDHNVIGIARAQKGNIIQADLLNRGSIEKIFKQHRPQITIHCAAMTDVNLCEKEKDKADEFNVTATKNLADFCIKYNSKLIFISTDAVFDGEKGDYKEKDKPGPVNIYGKTKAEAEKIVKQLDDYLIIRTAVLYGKGGIKFINKMADKLKNDEMVEVADDIRRSPTLIDDIAKAMKIIIKKDVKGILHIAGDTQDSLFGITKRIANALGKDSQMARPCSVAKYQRGIAPQAADTTLNTDKAKSLGIKMKSIEEGILFLEKN